MSGGRLRIRVAEVLDDGRSRGYSQVYFMTALGWPQCDDAELLLNCKALLRNPAGQRAAWEYKRKYIDELVLEDIVIDDGAALGFDADDIRVARDTMGL